MEWGGLFYTTHKDVYVPSDDSFLLASAVDESVDGSMRVLDVGCGTGIVALAAARTGAEVVCTDINPMAVRLSRYNARQNRLDLTAVQADLVAGVRGRFDVVSFNPPYLPTGEEDTVEGPLHAAFDGGPDGNAVVLRFAKQLARLADRPRRVLVVHSSLSDPAPLASRLAELGYARREIRRERHFYEQITVQAFDAA